VTATLRDALAALAEADVLRFGGLPEGVTLAAVAAVLPVDEHVRGSGDLGEPGRSRAWLAMGSTIYEGGLRVWLDVGAADLAVGLAGEAAVLLVDGRDPVDASGEPRAVPDLGEPDAVAPAVIGRVPLPDGERVHAARGLATVVNPANGLLLGVRGFVPTTPERYLRTLRPVIRRAVMVRDPS
jgi:hypothetical protein